MQESERKDGRAEEDAGSAEEEEESEGYDDSSFSSAEVDDLYPAVCKPLKPHPLLFNQMQHESLASGQGIEAGADGISRDGDEYARGARRGVQYTFDLFSGTSTSAALYALRRAQAVHTYGDGHYQYDSLQCS